MHDTLISILFHQQMIHIHIAFADVIHQLWSSGSEAVSPGDLKYKIEKYAPRFSGYGYHISICILEFCSNGQED